MKFRKKVQEAMDSALKSRFLKAATATGAFSEEEVERMSSQMTSFEVDHLEKILSLPEVKSVLAKEDPSHDELALVATMLKETLGMTPAPTESRKSESAYTDIVLQAAAKAKKSPVALAELRSILGPLAQGLRLADLESSLIKKLNDGRIDLETMDSLNGFVGENASAASLGAAPTGAVKPEEATRDVWDIWVVADNEESIVDEYDNLEDARTALDEWKTDFPDATFRIEKVTLSDDSVVDFEQVDDVELAAVESKKSERLFNKAELEKIALEGEPKAEGKEGSLVDYADFEAMPYEALIDTLNALTIDGRAAFKARQEGKDVVIDLLVKDIDQKIAQADPIVDLVPGDGLDMITVHPDGSVDLWTEEWSVQDRGTTLLLDPDSSKIDRNDLSREFKALAQSLENDCLTLTDAIKKARGDGAPEGDGSIDWNRLDEYASECRETANTVLGVLHAMYPKSEVRVWFEADGPQGLEVRARISDSPLTCTVHPVSHHFVGSDEGVPTTEQEYSGMEDLVHVINAFFQEDAR